MHKNLNILSNTFPKKKILFSEMFFIISLISFNLGINEASILFTIFVFFSQRNNLKIPKNIFIFLGILMISGTLLSFFYSSYLNISSDFHQSIFIRNRFFVIQILYSLSVAIFLIKIDKIRILYLLYIFAMINLIVGIIQLNYQIFFSTFSRLSMLTSEPSSIAMFYAFAVPLLLLYLNYNKSAKKRVWSFIIIGILIVSKAQILVFLFWLIIFLFRKTMKKKIILIFILSLIVFFCAKYFLQISQVNSLIRFLSISFTEGFTGLNEQNQIYTSFTFRLSGAMASLSLFLEYLTGIGFGTFYPLYIDYMNSSELGQLLSGSEIIEVLFYDGYATPKSIFLELLVSCGIFFLIPIIFITKSFLKQNLPYLLKVSLLSLLLVSLMVELAPFLTYFSILLILKHKFSSTYNPNLT